MARTVRVYDREFAKRSRSAIHPRVAEALSECPRGRPPVGGAPAPE
jgi:hypothetical protein